MAIFFPSNRKNGFLRVFLKKMTTFIEFMTEKVGRCIFKVSESMVSALNKGLEED